jgi:hypothetical protein
MKIERTVPIVLLTLIVLAASFVPVTATKQFLFRGHLEGTPNGATAQERYLNGSTSIEIDIQVTQGTFNFQIVSQSDFQVTNIAGPYDSAYVKARHITGNDTEQMQVPSSGTYWFILDDYGSTAPYSYADYQVWLLETPISPMAIIAVIGIAILFFTIMGVVSLTAIKRSHATKAKQQTQLTPNPV